MMATRAQAHLQAGVALLKALVRGACHDKKDMSRSRYLGRLGSGGLPHAPCFESRPHTALMLMRIGENGSGSTPKKSHEKSDVSPPASLTRRRSLAFRAVHTSVQPCAWAT